MFSFLSSSGLGSGLSGDDPESSVGTAPMFHEFRDLHAEFDSEANAEREGRQQEGSERSTAFAGGIVPSFPEGVTLVVHKGSLVKVGGMVLQYFVNI